MTLILGDTARIPLAAMTPPLRFALAAGQTVLWARRRI